jgi:hypothetical protein
MDDWGRLVSTAESLIAQFDRLVRTSGGELQLLGADDSVIRVGYRVGSEGQCEGDACILPEAELQVLMSETLARRDTSLRVTVERM